MLTQANLCSADRYEDSDDEAPVDDDEDEEDDEDDEDAEDGENDAEGVYCSTRHLSIAYQLSLLLS